MERDIVGKRPTFRPNRKTNNFYRIILWIGLILVFIWIYMGLQRGEIISPLEPTPTPTRIAESYFQEAQAYIEAGRLDDPSVLTTNTDIPVVNDAISASYNEYFELLPEIIIFPLYSTSFIEPVEYFISSRTNISKLFLK